VEIFIRWWLKFMQDGILSIISSGKYIVYIKNCLIK